MSGKRDVPSMSDPDEFVPDKRGFAAPCNPIPRKNVPADPPLPVNGNDVNRSHGASDKRPHGKPRRDNNKRTDDSETSPHAANAPYAPWAGNFQMATIAMGFALGVLWIMVAGGRRNPAIGVSFLFAAWSLFEFGRGWRRRFGKLFEDRHVKRAIRVMNAYRIKTTPNLMTKVGDVDLVIEDRYRFNVELKSWRSYGENPKFAKRERAVMQQMGAQRSAAKTDASILWLPQAKNTLWQALLKPVPEIGFNTWVVKGNARCLGKAVRKLMQRKLQKYADD